jgi:hypothetical protein
MRPLAKSIDCSAGDGIYSKYISMKTIVLLLLGLSLLMTGCGTDPSNFREPPQKTRITVREPIWVGEGYGIAGGGWQDHYIMPGNYVAKYSDEGDTYHQGAPYCLQFQIRESGSAGPKGKAFISFNCGIYVPFDSTKPALMYTIQGVVPDDPETPNEKPQADKSTVDAATPAVISQHVTNPGNANPVASGVGAGIGMGIVGGIIDMTAGHVNLHNVEVDRKKFVLTQP